MGTDLYRPELPRVYELYDLVPSPPPSGAYFRDFERTLGEWPSKRKFFADIERDLDGLDDDAWTALKKEIAPRLTIKDVRRGWQPLFDILNHAKAYNYLKRNGCTKIRFIPVSRVQGKRTPDLEAVLGPSVVLCEVKTINISEVEASRRFDGGVGTTQAQLDAGLFTKLASDLGNAEAQLLAYAAGATTKKLIYVVLNFDDNLHEYADSYEDQIAEWMARNSLPDTKVIFDIKPPFYSAMS